MSEYSELLKDPRWQKKRLQIFERDEWRCVWCEEDEITLHVHHLKYENDKDPWEIDNRWLITVCEDCHDYEYEQRKSEEKALLEVMKLCGMSTSHLNYFVSTLFILSQKEFSGWNIERFCSVLSNLIEKWDVYMIEPELEITEFGYTITDYPAKMMAKRNGKPTT